MKKFAKLQRIDGDHRITEESDGEFLYQLQDALLLALCQQGYLNMIQYRHAAEKLRRSYHVKEEPHRNEKNG